MAMRAYRQSPALPRELTADFWTDLNPPGRTILNENHQIIINHLTAIKKYHTIIIYDAETDKRNNNSDAVKRCIDTYNEKLTHVVRSLDSIVRQLVYAKNKTLIIRAIPYLHRTENWTPQKYLDNIALVNADANKHLSAIKAFAEAVIQDRKKIFPGDEFSLGQFYAINWTRKKF